MHTQIKSLLMISIMMVFATQHVAAENFSQQDMAFAFGDSALVTSDFDQIELLSSQEMMATEGERGVPGAIFGAGFGVWAYGGYLAAGGQPSWSGAALNIGGGALAGAFGGPTGIARYYAATRSGSILGYAGGRLQYYGY